MPVLATTGRGRETIDNSHLGQRPMNARPTNVESAIPRTPQRDPGNFPYEYHEYPKMMSMVANQAYLDVWMERHKQLSDDNRTQYWPGGRPKVGVSIVPILDELGEPITVYDEEEEAAFRAEHPEAMTIVSVTDELEKLRADNKRLSDLLAENAKLRAEAAAGRSTEVKDEDPAKNEEPAKNALGAVTNGDKPATLKAKPSTELPPKLK